MGWGLRLVEVEGPSGSVDVLEIDRPGNLDDLADPGLRLPDGKQLLSQVQQAVVAAQCRDHAAQRQACRACGAAGRVKDYRPRRIATLFGMVTVRLPRFRCAGCRGDQAGIECQATREWAPFGDNTDSAKGSIPLDRRGRRGASTAWKTHVP